MHMKSVLTELGRPAAEPVLIRSTKKTFTGTAFEIEIPFADS